MAAQAPHLVHYYISCCVWLHPIVFTCFLGKDKNRKLSSPKWILPSIQPSIKTPLFFFPFSLVSVTLEHRTISEKVVWEAEIKVKRDKQSWRNFWSDNSEIWRIAFHLAFHQSHLYSDESNSLPVHHHSPSEPIGLTGRFLDFGLPFLGSTLTITFC